jgi:hypothetical protein
LHRLSHNGGGDDVACVTPFDKLTRTGPLALGRRLVPLRVIATFGTEKKPVNINSAPSADAEEICKLLEQAVLKYFPGPIENVDTFLFANGDESAVGDRQSACAPGAPSNHLQRFKRGLRFLCFV